jgi:hypothetical protein
MEQKRDLSWLTNWRVLTLCGGCIAAGFLLGMLIFGSPWHLPPAWGDIPTWITAIATTGLLAGAIITATYAIKAFGSQSREVGILLEQHEQDTTERRIAQAARVFTRIPRNAPGGISPVAENASGLPIFDVHFWYSEPGGASGSDYLGTILPGDKASTNRTFSSDDALARAILAFRDAAGVRWMRMPDGTLKEQFSATARESVLVALGAELPKPDPQPPSLGGKHNLPTSFRRLDNQVTHYVRDSIMVYPSSRGILSARIRIVVKSVPVEEHRIEVTSSDPDNQGVYIEDHGVDGSEGFYTFSCDVWNYRDSPAYAKLVVGERTSQAPPDIPQE